MMNEPIGFPCASRCWIARRDAKLLSPLATAAVIKHRQFLFNDGGRRLCLSDTHKVQLLPKPLMDRLSNGVS
jgi:hypothetical protein